MNNTEKFKMLGYKSSDLISVIKESIEKSGATVKELSKNSDNYYYSLVVELPDKNVVKCHIYARNISGSGWSDKPEIKRIQIREPVQIIRQNRDEFYMLCGVCKYDSQLMIAVWDPMNYMTHCKCCSCYVFVSSFEKAMQNGLFFGLNKGKEVMVCKNECICEVIKEFSSRFCYRSET